MNRQLQLRHKGANQMYIYILKLQNRYNPQRELFYVGRTTNLEARINSHNIGKGSQWTRRHKPIEVVKIIEAESLFQQDMWVKIYMNKYSIDQVRGGSYSRATLSPCQIKFLRKQLRNAKDQCFKCGQEGHFSYKCPNRYRKIINLQDDHLSERSCRQLHNNQLESAQSEFSNDLTVILPEQQVLIEEIKEVQPQIQQNKDNITSDKKEGFSWFNWSCFTDFFRIFKLK